MSLLDFSTFGSGSGAALQEPTIRPIPLPIGGETPVPICQGCEWYDGQPDQYERPTCRAFPDGIPDAILNSDVDHRRPYSGDHGGLFSPVTVQDLDYAAHLFGPMPDGKADPATPPVTGPRLVLGR